jgi:hypothetical protein
MYAAPLGMFGPASPAFFFFFGHKHRDRGDSYPITRPMMPMANNTAKIISRVRKLGPLPLSP